MVIHTSHTPLVLISLSPPPPRLTPGSRMGIYEYVRNHVFGKNPDGSFPLHKAVLAGMSTGALAQFVASPTDLVKVQMQMEGRRKLEGKPPRFKVDGWMGGLLLCNLHEARGSWCAVLAAGHPGRLHLHCPQRRGPRPVERLCTEHAARRPREPGRPHHLRHCQAAHSQTHIGEGGEGGGQCWFGMCWESVFLVIDQRTRLLTEDWRQQHHTRSVQWLRRPGVSSTWFAVEKTLVERFFPLSPLNPWHLQARRQTL